MSVPAIHDAPDQWSAFRDKALEQGFRAIDAIPMRLGERTIGTLNLLLSHTGDLPGDDLVVAQAFAYVATIGVLRERTMAQSGVVRRQLDTTLDSRALIEQAKGVVAHTRCLSVEEA